jgi:hypothetical protein
VAGGLSEARAALTRGDADLALVVLWNEVEAARVRGDERTLRAISALAQAIAAGGDEGQRREAERLVEQLQALELGEDVEPASTSRVGIGNLLWLLVLLAVVIANVLGARD